MNYVYLLYNKGNNRHTHLSIKNIEYGTRGILVITQDGKQVFENGTLGNKDPIHKYYAYRIWNSFGIDFVSDDRKRWDTENGVVFGDEVNLFEPGFKSGWNKIDGIWLRGYAIEDTEDNVAPNKLMV